ncbi:hypothetical protein [Falsarthrobacter nasiphocae]|uniref:Secreted protein n=1 Tax=Falsarthrobacter nasiphocae TaxID=189863 RepID=A0AAE4C5V7_9MICC|nr:hypothetical protein [Falsarthrobacter nasiphocae]MDR6891893.1 hypothetical protein [Falsarthrobacter nasiphocae]
MKKIASRTAAAAVVATLGFTGLGASAQAAEAPTTGLDLAPYVTVSSAKAPGFAGAVAIRVKNVGSERYYGEFPAVTFRVDVKTEKGPKGVDRLMTPGWYNGAYMRDLGFNESTSTRTFEITLSNPVPVGKDQLVATLNFGDGLTREGRLTNSITVTQTGRLAGDTSTGNDQNISSLTSAKDDFGRPIAGLF